ncbi:MBL fold metallo-hydrolase [Frondihabitans australicus]|uniref:Glyoxylase-like metal-dependent hydrolase (Beta-lactamase superfamily II) n=1 Tax=Frondihabitans australicus TaxID=386892 RepID=A0A495IN51_9MICO|nr:MBL fold metallo-hydrolase [Frondihabitans australicus]RKR76611.1 glyoxylase-like metal-dependent hydrolase (beta-lactamase superfamily II) [Frondihabitans australicus]
MTRRLVEVSPGVLVATSRRDTTTSTVVRATPASNEVLLVDPAWEPDELEALADDLDELGLQVVAGFSTHAHFDHVLWHPRFGSPPRWASAETARRATSSPTRDELLGELGPWPAELLPLVGDVAPLPGPGRLLPWQGQPVEVVVHDAHVPGHGALWLSGSRILLAGDMLSDVEPPLPATDDPAGFAAYLDGLETLRPFVEQAALVIPGHGHVGQDPKARLAADLRALDSLARGRGLPPGDTRVAPA